MGLFPLAKIKYFILPCTSPGAPTRKLPVLQNVPGAQMPAPARLSKLLSTVLRTFPGWNGGEVLSGAERIVSSSLSGKDA